MPRIRARTIAEHKQLTRGQIIDAGYQMFVAYGFARTSLAEVAALAGLGRTTLYEYFPSKEDLLHAVVDAKVLPAFEDLVGCAAEGSTVDRLEQLFRAAFETVATHPDLGVLLFGVAREMPRDTPQRIWSAAAPLTEEIRKLCAQGVAEGEMSANCPDRLAQSVRDLLVGGLDVVAADGADVDVEALLADRLRFLRTGISV